MYSTPRLDCRPKADPFDLAQLLDVVDERRASAHFHRSNRRKHLYLNMYRGDLLPWKPNTTEDRQYFIAPGYKVSCTMILRIQVYYTVTLTRSHTGALKYS